jgi:pyruvate kinase
MKLTKIVATLGPATDNEKIIAQMIKNGVDVFRFNLKHNDPRWHQKTLSVVKRCSKKVKKTVATMFDLPKSDLKTIKKFLPYMKEGVDFLALSLIKSQKDIEIIKKLKLKTKIIAKIETDQAIKNFEKILEKAEAIMVARGDLGKYIPLEKVPYYQKMIIKKCIEKGKPVITATQMLKSMTENPFPTRAEVSDVANAVLDYTDAVMLSEETAIGKYPLEAISTMVKVVEFWERERPSISAFDLEIDHQTKAVCYSAYQMWQTPFCQNHNIKAFLVLTKGGMTVQMLSRLRPKIPIIAITNDKFLTKRLSLVFGTFPFYLKFDVYKKKGVADIEKFLAIVKKEGFAKSGEKIIAIYAEDWKNKGQTGVIRIQEIP